MDRTDLTLVLAIAQHGSLTATAEALQIAPSAVTKRLARLEAELGLLLFQRTTRRVAATLEGELLCDRARLLLAEFEALEQSLQERKSEAAGLIRLAATLGFGRIWLAPVLAEFQAMHPAIQIQLQLCEQLPDLAAEGFDGAVWLWAPGPQRSSEWTARKLAGNQRVLVASPAYVRKHGLPATPDDLAQHNCLIVRENGRQFDTWQLQAMRGVRSKGSTPPEQRVRVQGLLSSNSGEVVRDWCLQGRGVMLRSLWDVQAHLASGKLVRLLPQYAMLDADIQWLAPYRPQTPKRVRLLIDCLAEKFRNEPWRLVAKTPVLQRQ
ncbi:MAG: LysR family transcriptional regulator [Polaromonas sp.]|nr:LysR family transcriptional regulator [Polaromonas sp.]MDP3753045.1 LysR family transcriptional regulator [Polaromonas sp.]